MTHSHPRLVALSFALASLAAVSRVEAQRRARHPRRPSVAVVASATPDTATVARGHGVLDESSQVDEEGRFAQTRVVTLRRGDVVRYEVSSDEFDTLVRATGPHGERWEDDDGAGHGTDSRLRFTAPSDGRYALTVTSYGAGEVGGYRADLSVLHRDALGGGGGGGGGDGALVGETGTADEAEDAPNAEPAARPAPFASASAGTTYGIFVGVTRYGGENHDLPGSAEDAHALARAFERAGWMTRHNAVVLTDGEATLERVRQAFRTLTPRVGPGDTLVFFFDGHGNSSSLDLRGDDLSRRALGRLLDGVRGHSLVVLDACEAGGFASVVQHRPSRAGLFSSRANESSSTAPEVGSGGWLAYNLRRAVDGGVRRRPDGSVDFDDVVRYVEEDYRARNLTQNLVATRDPEGFVLGGTSAPSLDAPTNRDDDGTQFARNAPTNRDDDGTQFARNAPDQGLTPVAQLGIELVGQALNALTK